MPKLISSPAKDHGFTLIEVLVTLLIVAIGLLGLAGMQVTGLRNNLDSETRSQATLMANDIIERMRANPVGVANNDYADIDSTALDCAARPAPFCSNFNTGAATAAADCTPAEIAVFDAWVWYCGMPVGEGVRGGGIRHWLANGSATVSCNDDPCTPGSIHTVTVSWDEVSRDPDNPDPVQQSINIFAVP